jgi:DUF4097 and DUF4098 domain-containing protein YvlB
MIETFRTPGPLTLSIRIPAGTVELETDETDETRVEVERLRGALEPDEFRVELRDRGGRQEVIVHAERGGLLRRRDAKYRVAIRTPLGADVDLDVASADVAGNGTFGSVDVKSASGDVVFEEMKGAARVKTASGDVRLTAVGGEVRVDGASGDVTVGEAGADAIVRSASGSVVLGRAEAGVRVSTASGDVTVDSVARGAVRIMSASGDIEVGVRPGSKVFIDAKSMSGEMRSELEVTDAPSGSNGTNLELRAMSMSGDITIKRA